MAVDGVASEVERVVGPCWAGDRGICGSGRCAERTVGSSRAHLTLSVVWNILGRKYLGVVRTENTFSNSKNMF